MNTRLLIIGAATLLFAACHSESDITLTKDTNNASGAEATVPAPDITAVQETNSPTKSLLEVDGDGVGTIYWTPADEINVFYGSTSTHYVSQNTENATTAVFKTTDVIGTSESASENIWGLYPYNEDATCSGSAVNTTLPATQYGVPGTFDDDLFITLAHNTSTALVFYNVCGGIKFSLSRDDITSITFRGNNNEDIAGDISLNFVDGLPNVSVTSGQKEITLTPKVGNTFVSGENYYLVLLPCILSGGFTMTFETTEGLIGSLSYSEKAINIKRSVFSKKANIDTYATFVIPFSNDWVKTQLVASFDTDGDGEISIAEASVVSSLGTLLRYHDTETFTFDEFRFFTNVKTLGNYAFQRNTMVSIMLPNGLSTINDYAFSTSKHRIRITVPPTLSRIGTYAFHNSLSGCDVYISDLSAWCSIEFGESSYSNPLSAGLISDSNSKGNLYFNGELISSLTIPSSVTSIPARCFLASTITELHLNELLESIGQSAFSQTLLQSIDFNIGLNSIGAQAFSSCTSLTNVDLPSSISTIGMMAFYNCTSLSSITIRATTPPSGGSMMFDYTNDCPIYVPVGSVDAYKVASGWSTYADRIQAIP